MTPLLKTAKIEMADSEETLMSIRIIRKTPLGAGEQQAFLRKWEHRKLALPR